MSHRWDCPTPWEAEREGERAYERGRSSWSNPYDDRNSFDRHPCHEAERSWDRGYRYAERRHEEEVIEQRAAERRRQEREWAQQEEEALYMQAQEDWQQQYDEQMAADEAAHYFWMEQDQLLDQSETI